MIDLNYLSKFLTGKDCVYFNKFSFSIFTDNFRNKAKSMFLLYIHAVSISNNKDIKEGGGIDDTQTSEFSIKVMIFI